MAPNYYVFPMLIAVLSDSHDNMDNLKKALAIVKERGISRGFHLGDFVAPFMLKELADSGIAWQCVWGNNDGDKLLGYLQTIHTDSVDLATTDFRELEAEGRKVFLTHYPQIGRMAALSGQYDAAFYGHVHTAASEVIRNQNGPITECLYANPGEVYGHRYGKPSLGIYDTATNGFEFVAL